jgi:hypothetical protein
MEFLERANGWNFILHQGGLRLIKIDYRLTFVLMEESATIELCIANPFTMTNKGADSLCVPEDPKSLAPLLPLINSQVDSIEVRSSGQLAVYFGSEVTIKGRPDPSYEAWQLGIPSGFLPSGFLMICSPGGKVVIFQKESAASG